MQTFNLDISKRIMPEMLNAKQRNVGTKILINITDNGKEYAIPADVSFSVWYSGKSGEGNYTEIGDKSAFAVEGNTVTVELIMQMLNNPGEHLMCLVMNDAGGKQQGLWNIPYFVEAIPGADSEEAKQYYQAFVVALKKSEAAAENAETSKNYANAAAQIAEEAAERAADAADRAESAGGGSGGGTIIVSLAEGNVATHTASEIYDAIQNNQNVIYHHVQRLDDEFISLKSSKPNVAVFSKTGYPTEFDIFNIEIDSEGTVSYKTSFSSDLVNQVIAALPVYNGEVESV